MPKDNAGYQDGSPAPSYWTGQPGTIVSQPTSNRGVEQIQMIQIPLWVPPGLEYLEQVDGVMINQQAMEILTGCKTERRYEIYDKLNQPIFKAKKDKDFGSRNYWTTIEHFEMSITDMSGQEVIRFDRPQSSDSCCFSCRPAIDVFSYNGTLLGTVEQESTLCVPKYVVKNDQGENVLQIKGPCYPFSCAFDNEFYILALDGKTQVGKVSKKWLGILQELCNTEATYEIDFPMDLDIKMKATMIGACLLINFMYFQNDF